MASLAQNTGENLWHVPWNNNNNNTEFEGGQKRKITIGVDQQWIKKVNSKDLWYYFLLLTHYYWPAPLWLVYDCLYL